MVKAIIFDCFGVLYHSETGRDEAMMELVHTARQKHKVGVLSNWNTEGMNQLFTPKEQQEFFDDVVLSESVGVEKPQPEIYELACQRLGVEPSETLFIDDVERNCVGARDAGLQTFWYEGPDSLPALKQLVQ